MSITTIERGYLEDPYLEDGYLTTIADGFMGAEATFVIATAPAAGMQCKIVIVDRPSSQGQQANFQIDSGLVAYGMQADFTVGSSKASGMQSSFSAENFPTSSGMQIEIEIVDRLSYYGMQFSRSNFAHLNCYGYLEDAYLDDGYLRRICAHGGMQAEFGVIETHEMGMQAQFVIDKLSAYGMQAEFVIEKEAAYGMQTEFITIYSLAMQCNIALYNTTNLRFMYEFPSRGLSGATGTNAWGNPAGTGQSWKANSTEAGDFGVNNVNTDIVEQVWRSDLTVVTGVNLDCDTERPQGVFLDTLAIMSHNLTSSASINLIGSTMSDFSVIGTLIPLEARSDDPNIYYIAPTLPTTGYRYWRIAIDDASNPDNYLEIGTIVFGASSIFFGECFVDEVDFQLKDFADVVNTEAFTNVKNSRAQKKNLRLEFRSLSYLKSNFRLMRRLFREAKTILKVLWVPTPDPVNQEYTSRFALFAKLTQIPSEGHNNKGGDADYVTFNVELDESN
jgi:hypothetical protein